MDVSAVTGAFTAIPTDWIILFAVSVLLALDALRSGTGRAAALVVSAPLALLLFSAFKSAAVLASFGTELSTPTLQAALFVVLLAAVFLLVRRMSASWISDSGAPLQALIAGVAATAVLTVVWISIPSLDALWSFGTQVKNVFGEPYRFWWVLGALAALAFIRR